MVMSLSLIVAREVGVVSEVDVVDMEKGVVREVDKDGNTLIINLLLSDVIVSFCDCLLQSTF